MNILNFRKEKDLLGECLIENENYFGINTHRAIENFNLCSSKVNLKLIYEIALVKKAAADANFQAGLLEKDKANAISTACDEILDGSYNFV